eukprot:CAMPEP_0198261844 /NCGR_PEP_ID=MMETSP1447-20131203/10487_1 /TAXON_ID=420782 /ORGANISM="Chaetoceros dichaeta, Strain CCMP1751" /LENGTH=127 /DNA_ID=CAMNT_0043949891 /DNA_START=108 /DNA_END=491 /DNA_ORIENTATION=-
MILLCIVLITALFSEAQAFTPSKPAIIGWQKTSTSLSVVDPVTFTDFSTIISDATDNIPFPTGDTGSSNPSPLRIAGSVFGGVVVWYLCGFGMESPKPKRIVPPEGLTLSVVEETEKEPVDSQSEQS